MIDTFLIIYAIVGVILLGLSFYSWFYVEPKKLEKKIKTLYEQMKASELYEMVISSDMVCYPEKDRVRLGKNGVIHINVNFTKDDIIKIGFCDFRYEHTLVAYVRNSEEAIEQIVKYLKYNNF